MQAQAAVKKAKAESLIHTAQLSHYEKTQLDKIKEVNISLSNELAEKVGPFCTYIC